MTNAKSKKMRRDTSFSAKISFFQKKGSVLGLDILVRFILSSDYIKNLIGEMHATLSL